EVEHVRDAPALVPHLERLPVVAPALADLAGYVDVGKEVHLDLHEPVALTGLAPPAFHIERESSGTVASHFGIGELGKELPDRREETGVRGRVRSRRAADGTLVDIDDLVDLVEPLDCRMRAWDHFGPVEMARQRLI